LHRYPQAAEVVWAQEEPANMGAWRFVWSAMQPLLDQTQRELRYVGRPESASPAAGSLRRHQEEQGELVREALISGPPSRKMHVVTRRRTPSIKGS
jgi:2-oxoglutarate dehydrogenase E1 component